MRILVQALTAAPGGSISVLTALLGQWPADDEITCLAWRPEMAAVLRETGHQVIEVEAGSTPAALWRSMTLHRRRIERWRPDVVFCQQYVLPGLREPQVVHHRNLLRFEPDESPSLKARGRDAAVGATLRRSAISVFNSQTLRDAATARWPLLASRRTAVVHNAVEVSDFEPLEPRRDPERLRVLVPQSDMRHKRNEVAVEVLERLIRHLRLQDDSRLAEMTFVGAGEYAQVRAAAQRLGLNDRIRIPGYLTRQDLAATYAECDVALITSQKESFCNPVVEAHAAGVPIVTTPLPVFDEISGPLSMSAADSSAAALTSKLIDALDHAPRDVEARAAGRLHAQAFSGVAKAQECRGVLLDAIGQSHV